ncbi:uncharacterized protein LOC131640312 [Vicia villosa]|uniref:uncharacterized protein LOC131640312 n=1 Tax=Vicia villosa TaxID=3911 RepID=UPI00273B4DFC|nr:uncharacterized protein LOC131640312 [Vicia villosa]
MAFQSVFGRDDIIEEHVIISLDLSTETFTRLMPPENYDNDGDIMIPPNICVLMDSLCFSYDKETEFFIWQMTKFEDEKSWSKFLKFSYHNVGIDFELGHPRIKLTRLHLSQDGIMLKVWFQYVEGSSAIEKNKFSGVLQQGTLMLHLKQIVL